MSKKIISTSLALSILGLIAGYILTSSVVFGLCNSEAYVCRDLLNNIGDPLFYGMGALAVVFLFLLFVPRAASAWKKFAIWFVPLAILLFIFYPEPGSGDLFSPYPEQIFQWTSFFYVIVSLIIIIYKGIKGRHRDLMNPPEMGLTKE